MKLGDCAGVPSIFLFINVGILYNEICFKLEICIAYEFGVISSYKTKCIHQMFILLDIMFIPLDVNLQYIKFVCLIPPQILREKLL